MSGTDEGQRAVPFLCPFCGEEDLRPFDEPPGAGRWHCRSCLRVFAIQFFGVRRPEPAPTVPDLRSQP